MMNITPEGDVTPCNFFPTQFGNLKIHHLQKSLIIQKNYTSGKELLLRIMTNVGHMKNVIIVVDVQVKVLLNMVIHWPVVLKVIWRC